MTELSGRYMVCYLCALSRLAGGYSIPNSDIKLSGILEFGNHRLRCVQAGACETIPTLSGAGQPSDRRWFGILAVQGRYKEYLCPSVLKRPLRYMQSDRCPISSSVCNSLTPFHGGNTGSNPVGDAKSFQRLAADWVQFPAVQRRYK
jgi:hypothetical protein